MTRQLASRIGLALCFTAPASAAWAEPRCATVLEVGDMQHFVQSQIRIPADCHAFSVTLRHTGDMPVNAMGHNWVLTRESDMAAVTRDGVGAGLVNGFLSPHDPRVIAHTRLVGARQETTISFSTLELAIGETYVFFCSFPGHAHSMHGHLTRGP
ncbi:azurin [Achromobacter sp. GG226]|uniref:azurin n=1 Tax=Verticiella alkaliphila TaxID=2779529 RepID=UPI001C0AF8FB|nr:azurin [Verticiella sp. GG226]MBU4609303.1 azurin [Verticiella sp. GG226]